MSNVDFKSLIAGLQLSEFDRSSLSAELEFLPASYGVREGVVAGLVHLLRERDNAVERYHQLAAHFPRRGAFSYQPLAEFALKLAELASSWAPHERLPRATNSLVQHAAEMGMFEANPITKPLVRTAGSDPGEFLDLIRHAHATMMLVGEIELEGKGTERILRVGPETAGILALFLPGLIQGTIRYFGRTGRVEANRTSCGLVLEVSWEKTRRTNPDTLQEMRRVSRRIEALTQRTTRAATMKTGRRSGRYPSVAETGAMAAASATKKES